MTDSSAAQGPRISYAQNGEDVRLWRAFDAIESGCYVEVGGYEPTSDSISRSFYDRGWSGVIVEPVADLVEQYREARPRDRVVQCLAGEAEGEAELTVFPGTGLSTAVPRFAQRHGADGLEHYTVSVPVRRLDSILDDEALDTEIHFMMVDVEGAEESVLRGIDLDRYRPWVLIVESTEPRTTARAVAWQPLVLEHGYREAAFDGLNTFYVAVEHEELAALLRDPPNVLDNYIGYQHTRALEQWGTAAAELAEASGRLAAANAELEAVKRQLQATEADRDACRSTAEHLQAKLDALYSSVSWKITTPLRKVRALRN